MGGGWDMPESNPVPEPRKKHHRINYALAATLVASGVTLEEAAKQTGAKNANTLGAGLRRKGVTATACRNMEPVGERSTNVTLRLASQAKDVLREQFASLLGKHVGQLDAIPAKANLKHLRQVANVAEPLARTAKIVCGWGDDGPAKAVDLSVMVAVRVDQAPQVGSEPAQDIQAVVVEAPSSEHNPNTAPK